MKSKLLLIALIASLNASAQYDMNHVKKDSVSKSNGINWFEIRQRTYVGGDFSLRFGNLTYVYTAPIVGFEFYKNVSAGVTGIYQLYRFNNGGSIFKENTYGGGLFMRWKPLNFLLLQTEFDMLNTIDYSVSGPTNQRVNVPVFLFGVGYAGSIGDRAYYSAMLMYDFINDANMPLPKLISPFPIYLKYGFTFYLG